MRACVSVGCKCGCAALCVASVVELEFLHLELF
jgi:hypothetical protein